VGVGRRQREHEAVVGHAELPGDLVGAHEQGGRLVDVDVGAQALEVRERHDAVVGGGRPDLLGRVRHL
jgi:hypothetical protein